MASQVAPAAVAASRATRWLYLLLLLFHATDRIRAQSGGFQYSEADASDSGSGGTTTFQLSFTSATSTYQTTGQQNERGTTSAEMEQHDHTTSRSMKGGHGGSSHSGSRGTTSGPGSAGGSDGGSTTEYGQNGDRSTTEGAAGGGGGGSQAGTRTTTEGGGGGEGGGGSGEPTSQQDVPLSTTVLPLTAEPTTESTTGTETVTVTTTNPSSGSCVDIEGTYCPAGYYRTSPVVFSCNATVPHIGCWMMQPHMLNKLFDIPPGVSGMNVTISSSEGAAHLHLFDPAGGKDGTYVVSPWKGTVNKDTLSGSYGGLKIVYSGISACGGSATSGVCKESFKWDEESAGTFVVSADNKAAAETSLTIDYKYKKLDPCPEAAPVGCDMYDERTAQQVVLAWSKSIDFRYTGCEDTWYNEIGDQVLPDLGIGWHKWATVWSQLGESASGGGEDVWQLGFAFLDRDRNGYINKEEFLIGCTLHHSQQLLMGSYNPAAIASGEETVPPTTQAKTGPSTTAAPQAVPATTVGSTTPVPVGKQCSDAIGCVTCPDGYYRTGAILFKCDGSSGSTCVILEPQLLNEVQSIPAGVQDLHLVLRSDAQADLSLYDPSGGNGYIVNKDAGIVTDKKRSGTYEGLSIAFSGDDPDAPTSETIDLQGAIPTELYLRVRNFAASEEWALLEYSHQGVVQCNSGDVPLGCAPFDRDTAVSLVSSWSAVLEKQEGDVDQAWAAVVPDPASSGISWYQWETVWEQAYSKDESSTPNAWQLSFAFLDGIIDGVKDCIVSQEEFRRAFRRRFDDKAGSKGGVSADIGEAMHSGNLSGQARSFIETNPGAGMGEDTNLDPADPDELSGISTTTEDESGIAWWEWFLLVWLTLVGTLILALAFSIVGRRHRLNHQAFGAGTASFDRRADPEEAEDQEGGDGADAGGDREPLLVRMVRVDSQARGGSQWLQPSYVRHQVEAALAWATTENEESDDEDDEEDQEHELGFQSSSSGSKASSARRIQSHPHPDAQHASGSAFGLHAPHPPVMAVAQPLANIGAWQARPRPAATTAPLLPQQQWQEQRLPPRASNPRNGSSSWIHSTV